MQEEGEGMEEHCKTPWPRIYQNRVKHKKKKVYKTHAG